jgi:L-asparaginase
MSEQATRPTVAILGTGGTIGSSGRDSLDTWEYMDHGGRLSLAELLERFPEVGLAAEIEAVDAAQLSSSGITPANWLDLAQRIHALAARPAPPAGIVVTHGTATLEETAYFLNLTLKTEIPVVVVGAQRPASGFATDAGSNLASAVRVAASAEARGLGVLVVLNEEIHGAREVTKGSTLRLETFRAPDLGMLGYADPDGRIALYRRPSRRHAPDTEFDVGGLDALPRVDIAYAYAGADGAAIDAFATAGAKAIISATLAPGLPTPAQIEALERARAGGVVTVYSSRAGSGRVLLRQTMREAGIVAADNLNPQKARVLAMLALTVSREPVELQRIFDSY